MTNVCSAHTSKILDYTRGGNEKLITVEVIETAAKLSFSLSAEPSGCVRAQRAMSIRSTQTVIILECVCWWCVTTAYGISGGETGECVMPGEDQCVCWRCDDASKGQGKE